MSVYRGEGVISLWWIHHYLLHDTNWKGRISKFIPSAILFHGRWITPKCYFLNFLKSLYLEYVQNAISSIFIPAHKTNIYQLVENILALQMKQSIVKIFFYLS